MSESRGPGRPPAGDEFRVPRAVRCNAAEWSLITAAAKRAGVSASQYVREAALQLAVEGPDRSALPDGDITTD